MKGHLSTWPGTCLRRPRCAARRGRSANARDQNLCPAAQSNAGDRLREQSATAARRGNHAVVARNQGGVGDHLTTGRFLVRTSNRDPASLPVFSPACPAGSLAASHSAYRADLAYSAGTR
jgi:hypothetical protein